jgi:3-hydroxybutyrate dehydrogenase
VRTPLVESQLDAQAKSHGISRERVAQEIMLKPMPKGAFIEMAELSAAVEFLLADTARNITGQCITIDGGWTAQ